jgi:hypothetical protein
VFFLVSFVVENAIYLRSKVRSLGQNPLSAGDPDSGFEKQQGERTNYLRLKGLKKIIQ